MLSFDFLYHGTKQIELLEDLRLNTKVKKSMTDLNLEANSIVDRKLP